jgi:hypothetical protein
MTIAGVPWRLCLVPALLIVAGVLGACAAILTA